MAFPREKCISVFQSGTPLGLSAFPFPSYLPLSFRYSLFLSWKTHSTPVSVGFLCYVRTDSLDFDGKSRGQNRTQSIIRASSSFAWKPCGFSTLLLLPFPVFSISDRILSFIFILLFVRLRFSFLLFFLPVVVPTGESCLKASEISSRPFESRIGVKGQGVKEEKVWPRDIFVRRWLTKRES